MHHKQEKFEHPVRLAELDPTGTLERIGFGKGQVLAEIGAGTGIFSLPAAAMTDQMVYALEISDDMLDILREKSQETGLTNLKISKVVDDGLDLPDHIADWGLFVTSFHEVEHKEPILSELVRILKPQGRAAVIEFHPWETPMGPPLDHRITREEIQSQFQANGFALQEEIILGDNYYCLVYALVH